MNEETPGQEPPGDTQAEAQPGTEAAEQRQREASEAPQRDPRRRLRELLAIPDRDRPDALWDELIELEIQLAPGNRMQSTQPEGGRRQDSGRRPEQVPRQDSAGGAKPPKRFFKKPKRGPGAPPKPSVS